MSDNLEINSPVNVYDEVPYESYPYSMSHPYHLMTLGTLFGMNPSLPEKSRVLELGCAAGGNLIPHAVNYPDAKFVGVDFSRVQIDEANTYVKGLDLNNIEFHCCSITDIDESFGKFDYIICHGVISWVPQEVRNKIFEICDKNLTENGVAYISYNTLPGWNMIRTIRDMMLYHANTFTNIQDKIVQARLLLEFVKESLEGSNTPYAEVLKNEAELLSKQSDHYLRHDHLEEENKQFYFQEFIHEANKNSLQYLADCSISTMYVGNMPPKVAEKLKAVNDIVRTEQYMDFITNRRFRSTLLCHKSVPLTRNINNDDIMKFNLLLNVVPEKSLDQVDLNNSLESLTFYYNGNKDSSLNTSSPSMKAILYSFSEHTNNPISFDKLVNEANKKLTGNKIGEIKNELLNNAMRLFIQGYITITKQSGREYNPGKPKLIKLASYQVSETSKMWVTNLRHEIIGINFFEKSLYKYMDGKNDKNKLLELIMNDIQSGVLTLNKDGQKVEKPEEMKNEILTAVEQAITKAAVNALLIG